MKKTPEQITKMEEEVREFRAQEAQEAVNARREAFKPLITFVDSAAFKEVEAAFTDLEPILLQLGDFRIHFDAFRIGAKGLATVRDTIPSATTPIPVLDR